eukprot:3701755-Lingulodinium_polyedra.AAC.1
MQQRRAFDGALPSDHRWERQRWCGRERPFWCGRERPFSGLMFFGISTAAEGRTVEGSTGAQAAKSCPAPDQPPCAEDIFEPPSQAFD